MKILNFTDRFDRKNCETYCLKFCNRIICIIGYKEKEDIRQFNRNYLPSLIDNGSMVWRSQDDYAHCTTGPAHTKINGEMQYWLNDEKVSALVVSMS